jgi:DNA-binding response OmpR family regulator
METDTQSASPGIFRAILLHGSTAVAGSVIAALNHGLFEVRRVANARDAETLLVAWPAHLAVVDLDDEAVPDLLRLLGASNTLTRSATPVLALSDHSDLHTRLRAFAVGADDIVGVPFALEELSARAKVVARRMAGTHASIVPTIRLADTEIDVVGRVVRRRGREFVLTRTEQTLLLALSTHAGKTMTRDEILDAVWGNDFVPASNVVDRHVRDLRMKLGDDRHRPVFIETVAGAGYRFLPTFQNDGWTSRPSERRGRHSARVVGLPHDGGDPGRDQREKQRGRNPQGRSSAPEARDRREDTTPTGPRRAAQHEALAWVRP